MAVMQGLNRAQIVFQVTDRAEDEFEVVRYRGTEGLCQLYRFEIELASADTPPAFDDIVGNAARLRVQTGNGERFFHGIVSRFDITDEAPQRTHFRIELVPRLWLLTHRYNSRIFQEKTTPEIIEDILTKAGFAADTFKLKLEQSFEPREYCVQYRETDYNFLCRLMEEEGIWWCFEQTEETHLLIMADSASAYASIEGEAALPYQSPTGMNVGAEHVYRIRMGRSVRPGKVALTDFNFESPKLDLMAQGDCGRDPALEFYDFPGEYAAQGRGTMLAKLRAEEFETGRTVGVGQSNCGRLAPGRTFDLTEHPSTTLNDSYLITSVTHQGKQSVTRTATANHQANGVVDARIHQALVAARQHQETHVRDLAEALLQIVTRLQAGDPSAHRELSQWLYHAGQVSRDMGNVAAAAGASALEALALPNLIDDLPRTPIIDRTAVVYDCRFECVPASVTYRPARVTPWPVMRGSQTARVVGPEGEEIHTDQYARVKVQFHWDREGKFDDKSSCWIRVSQVAAGGGYGMLFLPRVGQEVVVDFLEGDPDKPLIIGRVYNADHMPPYALPDAKTQCGLKTRSTKGGGFNEIRLDDQKDKEHIFIHGQKDMDVRVQRDEKKLIKRDLHVIAERDQKSEAKRDDHRVIGQDELLHVKRDRSVKVEGKNSASVAKEYSLTVEGDAAFTFKKKHSLEATMSYTIKAMEVVIDASMGVTLKCGGNFVKVSPAGVDIVGTITKINSGGAPGSPAMVTAVAPQTAVNPEEPIESEPGEDTTYSQGPPKTDPLESAPWQPTTVEEPEKHWIGIRLWDDNGTPLAGERYQVVLADGTTVARGTLNAEGEAYIGGLDPGSCKVTFPELDGMTWDAGQASPEEGGGEAGSGGGPSVPSGPSLPI